MSWRGRNLEADKLRLKPQLSLPHSTTLSMSLNPPRLSFCLCEVGVTVAPAPWRCERIGQGYGQGSARCLVPGQGSPPPPSPPHPMWTRAAAAVTLPPFHC